MSLQDGSMSQSKDEQQYPSITQQGRNLVKLMQDVGANALQGQEMFVEPFEKQRRYDICQACEHFDRMRKRCRECGCFLQQKTALSAAECPIGKW